jgi:anti-sigma regulatory factor (Ser/Thr protein kinase)
VLVAGSTARSPRRWREKLEAGSEFGPASPYVMGTKGWLGVGLYRHDWRCSLSPLETDRRFEAWAARLKGGGHPGLAPPLPTAFHSRQTRQDAAANRTLGVMNRRAITEHPQQATLHLAGDKLIFGAEVHHRDATVFRRLMHKAQESGSTGFTFDFTATRYAYPVAMAQMVIQAETCRHEGMHFDVIDPKDKKTRRVFENSNWAHHLSPINYPVNETHPAGWLPVARYRNDQELLTLVNHTCEVVLKQAQVRRSALHGLEWSMNEIADNVFQHAEAKEGGLLAVTVAKGRRKVQFVVADSGQGIPKTIRTGGKQGLGSDVGAVRYALKQGVTRDRRVGAGNGLAGTLRIALAANGSFLVHSGRALVRASANDPNLTSQTSRPVDALDGTLVYFELTVNRDFDLEGALLEDGIHITDWDFLDAQYRPDDGDIRLLVKEEACSTATRIAGKPVRIKARNLVTAQTESKVILDFAGVERVTASFADEVVGKLYAALGAGRFDSRVAIDGLKEGLVRSQIIRSMSQRRSEAEDIDRRRERHARRRARDRARRGRKRRRSEP